ncbi:beta-ketoacyl synthase chain length factor [Inhella gelatinilytica]|uniref:Beta-ketoacyl synthase chain length factor n=1 Tax=Inhella gelatinilytica TaxID=2795030 RepID=A0A931IV77_9BURK|nr:beta-ketoacyl synthase chain length factor [Inhella gelatinilytica]MBH9551610.1 beta-ketoacyl synthase chain length factor [Inhella gelatinilytica]
MASQARALSVIRWSAWTPGLATPEAWCRALSDPNAWPPSAVDEAAVPPLSEVPPMVRRRIDPLGRAALQVAYGAQAGEAPETLASTPVVFASRWGELDRSLALLQCLAQSQPLSPTAFSHAVHNAIPALYSIQRAITAPVSAVSAGRFSLEAAWIEAVTLIAEGAPRVLVVAAEAPLPSPYAPSVWEPLRGLGLLLKAAEAGEDAIVLRPKEVDLAEGVKSASPFPPDVAALRFLLGWAPERAWCQGLWCWSRE